MQDWQLQPHEVAAMHVPLAMLDGLSTPAQLGLALVHTVAIVLQNALV